MECRELRAGLKVFGSTGETFQEVMTRGDRSRPVARSCLNGTAKRIYRSLYSNRVGGGSHWDTAFKECIINSNHYRNKHYDFLFLKMSQVSYCTRNGAILFDHFLEYVGDPANNNAVGAAKENERK